MAANLQASWAQVGRRSQYSMSLPLPVSGEAMTARAAALNQAAWCVLARAFGGKGRSNCLSNDPNCSPSARLAAAPSGAPDPGAAAGR